MEFFNKYWLQVVTILIALIGGIPGILTLIKYQKSKAKFLANTKVFSFGEINHEGALYQFVMLFLFISNKGVDPINPVGFQLFFRKGLKWLPMRITEIPSYLNQDASIINIEFSGDLNENDLGRKRYILKQGEYEPGVLMFTSNEISKEDFAPEKKKVFKLICEDVTGTEYVTKLVSEKQGEDSGSTGGFPLLNVRAT